MTRLCLHHAYPVEQTRDLPLSLTRLTLRLSRKSPDGTQAGQWSALDSGMAAMPVRLNAQRPMSGW